jgi:hypothetical protein
LASTPNKPLSLYQPPLLLLPRPTMAAHNFSSYKAGFGIFSGSIILPEALNKNHDMRHSILGLLD